MHTATYGRLLESWHDAAERRDEIYDAKIAGCIARLERLGGKVPPGPESGRVSLAFDNRKGIIWAANRLDIVRPCTEELRPACRPEGR